MKKEKTKVKILLPKTKGSLQGDKARAREETRNGDSGGKARSGLQLSFPVESGEDI